MSNKKAAPHTKSTIYDSMLKSKPYDDPLKKQPPKFQSSILKVMKESPQSEAADMSHKEPYKSTIYDMIQKHPPVKRQDKDNKKEEERKAIFREDTPPWVPPSPPTTTTTTTKTPKAPKTQAKAPSTNGAQPQEQQQQQQYPPVALPASSVGSVSRTLSLFK